jgi:hypothetical protein
LEQLLVGKRLSQKCDSASLHCSPTGFFIVVTSDENYRNAAARGSHLALQL